ncbi:MAG: fibrobacter succinogenes major paralogous domain-containing protein [Alistipes sp.]|nr:fibrobacter succinogenes major paralogous domain-containing protein [Alistipes sp.]
MLKRPDRPPAMYTSPYRSFLCDSPVRFIRAIARAPAAGYRFEGTGALTNVGVWGLYWSSSTLAAGGRHASYLLLRTDEVWPMSTIGLRTSGLSVRCVQHLRLPF